MFCSGYVDSSVQYAVIVIEELEVMEIKNLLYKTNIQKYNSRFLNTFMVIYHYILCKLINLPLYASFATPHIPGQVTKYVFSPIKGLSSVIIR